MKKDISIIYPFLNKKGGCERYLVEIISALDKQGCNITAYCGEVDQGLELPCEIDVIPFLKRPWFLMAISFCFSSQYRLQKKATNSLLRVQGASCFRQDIIHAHSVHKSWYLTSISRLKKFSRAWWLKLFNVNHYFVMLIEAIQFRSRNYQRVIAISELVKAELIKFYNIPPERIDVIYNGVNCDEFNPRHRAKFRNPIRERHGLVENDLVLIFVANEFPRKGLETVLESLALLENLKPKLLICGSGNLGPYQNQIKTLGLEDQIISVGACRELDQYYAASDIFVFPTIYEAFGLVITEAMAAGLAVAVSKSAGASELISDGVEGILLENPQDPKELENAILVLSDFEAREKIGIAGRKVAEKYTWDQVAGRIMKTYSKIQK